jgi:hypothetical protein
MFSGVPRKPQWSWTFIGANVLVWMIMVLILVLVPDLLQQWMAMEIARFVGWAVACAVWVVAIERHWQHRVGPLARFGVQLALWVSAALVAIWISEQVQSASGLLQ